MKKLLLLSAISICLNASAQNTWVQKADFGGAGRTFAVGFSIGNKGYIGTGLDSTSTRKDFWEYEPLTDSWTQIADFGGTSRSGAVGFSIGNKGYVGTGTDSAGQAQLDFWEYDPFTNSWTQKANFGGYERTLAVGFSIGNKGYICSGTGGVNSDLWEYDPLTDSWTQKSFMGANLALRYSAVGFSIGNKGYFGTGNDLMYDFSQKEFWEYDPALDVWTQKADFAGGRRSFATGFSIGGKGFLGTGEDNLFNSNNMSDFWEYIPATNIWRHRADIVPLSNLYECAVGFSIGNKGYIGTGSSTYLATNNSKAFYEYTPDTIISTCGASFFLYADTIPQTYIGVNSSGGVLPVTYTWNWGDGNFSSGATPSHTYSSQGTYNICLSITDAMGCIDSFCYSSYLYKTTANAVPITVTFNNSTTGILNPQGNNNSFSIIPNPANNNIHLIFNSAQKEPLHCEILNIVGKKVLEKTFAPDVSQKEYDLDISFLAKGIYFVRVGDGIKWENKKIVVQ